MKRLCNYSVSYFICPNCNNKFPLPRINGKTRERGHIKDLWCPYCKEVVKTLEVRDRDVYKNMCGEILY